ncbi:MAG: hypothetical protein MJZ68_09425, partial [archaeon]|nr:hypothetical protein [archaeon]
MDRRKLACMGGISKKHVKRGPGKSVNEELSHSLPNTGDCLQLVIKRNSEGDLIGVDGDWAYLLVTDVPENEVWYCMVRSFHNGMVERREALPMKKICDLREWEEGVAKTVVSKEDDVLGLTRTDTSFKNVVEPSDTPDVPEDMSMEVSESVIETSVDGPVVSSEAVSVTEDVPSVDRTVPYKDYRDLDVKLQDAHREIGKLKKRLEEIPLLEEEIRSKERANRSLVT